MSASEEKYVLNIASTSDYRFAVAVNVFSAFNERVYSGGIAKPIQEKLPRGIYMIRVELNGQVSDTAISLTEDAYVIIRKGSTAGKWANARIIDLPELYSSAPLQDEKFDSYKSSHPYYIEAAEKYSQENTCSPYKKKESNSLFIFFRFPSREQYEVFRPTWKNDFANQFSLLDQTGKTLVDFGKAGTTVIDEENGCLSFNADLPVGVYFLDCKGDDPRQIPLYVFGNWHTQVFLTLGDKPLFGTLRVFLSAEKKFSRHNNTNKYIDIFLDKLQNNAMELTDELIDFAAQTKFESPMLGLLCAYLYLQSKNHKKDDVISQMVHNLNVLILKNNTASPDLRALEILAAKHFGYTDFSKLPVAGTPMFRAGFQAIRDAAIEDSALIRTHSLNDYLSENMYYDSPFTTFAPVPQIMAEFEKKQTSEHELLHIESGNEKPFQLAFKVIKHIVKSKGKSKGSIFEDPFDAAIPLVGSVESVDFSDKIKPEDRSIEPQEQKQLKGKEKRAAKRETRKAKRGNAIKNLIEKFTDNYANKSFAEILGKEIYDELRERFVDDEEKGSYLSRTISEMLKENPELSPHDLSKMLHVPLTSIWRVLTESILNEEKKDG
ncbi:MAG: hypothetical protein ACRCYO_09930 [Bacteroidia bacterium]